jgi:DNA-binding transcriptional LysR family regulator
VSVNVLPAVVGRLRAERPGLSVRCEESDENDALIERLMSDDLDLSFLIGMPEHDGIDAVPLLIDPFVLLTAATDGEPTVDPTALQGVPMIGQSPCACQLSIDRSLRDYGVEPDYVFRTNDNAAVQAMVRAGMGQAILPFLAADPNDPGVIVSFMDPPIPPRVIAIGRRRGRTLAPAADRFIELAADVCRSLQQTERQLVDGMTG